MTKQRHDPAVAMARLAAARLDIVDGDVRGGSQRRLPAVASPGATAQSLAAAGYRAEHLVAISGRSDVFTLNLVLGCLAEGVPFMLLDINAPAAWRDSVVAQAGAAVHLDGHRAAVVADTGFPPPERRCDRIPPGSAYVAPTSGTTGTTGTPKLPIVGRAALQHHLSTVTPAFGLTNADVVLQTSSPGFDVWIEETMSAIWAGSRLVLSSNGLRQSFDELDAAVDRHGVTVLNLPASYWSAWHEHLINRGRKPGASLRLVVVGSEPVPTDRFHDWGARWPAGPRLLAAYGLTETTVTATVFDPERDHLDTRLPDVPLGRPLPGSRLCKLPAADPSAELLVAGLRLMSGYLGDPAATRAAFIELDGTLWLRTGDLVRDVDGSLCAVGRVDDQVKVHGVPVSMREVETQLVAAAGLRRAAVVHVQDYGLVAFAEPADPAQPQDGVLDRLAAQVPPAHLPARIEYMAELPRLVSDKLDRAALTRRAAELLEGVAAVPVTGTAALTPGSEEWLAAEMSRLLRTRLGPDDSFVAHGGNSLLAVRLLSTLERAGITLAVSDILTAGTPRRLRHIVTNRGSGTTAAVPLERCRLSRAPLSRQQAAVWLHSLLHPTSRAYNAQSVIMFAGLLRPEAVRAAIAEISSRHQVMRISVHDGDELPEQRCRPEVPTHLDVFDLSGLPDVEVSPAAARIGDAILSHQFDPTRPPLARWSLILQPSSSALYLVEHHLIHDGVSFAIVADELFTLLDGRPLDEPAAVDYLDYCDWQQRAIEAGHYDEQVREWQAYLADVPDLEPLIQRSEGSTDRRAHTVITWLDADLADQCRQAARRLEVTLFALLLSRFQATLALHFGQSDFAVGIAVANRPDPALARTVGMFVNTLAIRAPQEPDPLAAARSAAARLAWAYDRQHVPFDRVVAACRRRRRPFSTPLYQTTFSFDDAPVPPVSAAGLAGEIVEKQNGFAKVDLNLVAVTRAEQRLLYGVEAGEPSIKLIWEYRAASMSEHEVAELAQRFADATRHLCRQVLEDTATGKGS